jgi:hypothetical protein
LWLYCYFHTSSTVPYCLLHSQNYGYFQVSVLSLLLLFLPGLFFVYDHLDIRENHTELNWTTSENESSSSTLLLTFYVTLDKSITLSGPSFSRILS